MMHSRIATAFLVASLVGCEIITHSEEDLACARLNAFVPDTAYMQVGEVRQFNATGSVAAEPGRCLGMVKGGFTYSSDRPDIASVESATGVVTARTAGTARITARQRIRGVDYFGELKLLVRTVD